MIATYKLTEFNGGVKTELRASMTEYGKNHPTAVAARAAKSSKTCLILQKLFVSGDGYGVYSTCGVTNLNWQLRKIDDSFSQSASNVHTGLMYEGPDKRKYLKKLGQLFFDELNSIMRGGGDVTWEEGGITFTIRITRVYIGGDMPFKASVLGLCSVNHEFGCIYCDGPWKEWKVGGPPPPLRTVASIPRGAHVYDPDTMDDGGAFRGFTCTCTTKEGKTVSPRVFSTKAELGAQKPQNPSQHNAYTHAHRGAQWGEAPLICTFLAMTYGGPTGAVLGLFLPDVLHCLLRMTETVYHETVGKKIKVEQEGALKVFFHERRVWSHNIKGDAPAKATTSSNKQRPHPTFIGRVCTAIPAAPVGKKPVWEEMVEKFNGGDAAERERAKTVWKALADWWNAVKAPRAKGYNSTPQAHSKRLYDTAKALFDAIAAIASLAAALKPYMHEMLAHLPYVILDPEIGMDVLQYCTQGTEARNQKNKRVMRDQCNGKRLKVDATGRGRSSSFLYQGLAHEVMNRALTFQNPTLSAVAVLKRKRSARIRRMSAVLAGMRVPDSDMECGGGKENAAPGGGGI